MTALLIATTGGHLRELFALRPMLADLPEDVLWVTHDTLQSRDLLAGERTVFVPYQGSRDLPTALTNAARATRIVSPRRFDVAVSNGAAIAASFLPVARVRGLDTHYVECATRTRGPSLTGRILQRVPGIRLHTQHRGWAGGRWHFAGSVLDGFAAEPSADRAPITRAVVTLGTWQSDFGRLVERVTELLPAGVETLWQTGETDVSGLAIDAVQFLPPTELAAALRAADVVISHAGIGATLDALDAGRCPVVVARSKGAGEHVDDHQAQLVDELSRRGLAVTRDLADLDLDALEQAAARRIVRAETPPSFDLGPA